MNCIIKESKDLGKFLKSIRNEADLTQEEVAERMNTSKSNISAIENGKNITFNTFLNYLKVFSAVADIHIDYDSETV